MFMLIYIPNNTSALNKNINHIIIIIIIYPHFDQNLIGYSYS